MRFSVVHSTVYRYSAPVFLEPHTIRLRPRSDATQRLDAFQLQISPQPAGISECLDQDGNNAAVAWFSGQASTLSVQTSFQLETLRENPFDFILPAPASLELPLRFPEPLQSSLAPYREGATDAAVAEFARETAIEAGGQLMPYLDGLARRLFAECRQVTRKEGPPRTPAETLSRREGSCRDVAVLFCAACRAVGIAARFVSGYERESAAQDHAYMHAWAEVYVPGGGWRGFDPSRGLAVGTSHVAVAAAADPTLAAPISGSYRGMADAEMSLSILVNVA
jgi:transglutaminase-like putative cysteine protease